MREELRAVVQAEIRKLLDAQFIRKIRYFTWLANMGRIKKSNSKWWMCTN